MSKLSIKEVGSVTLNLFIWIIYYIIIKIASELRYLKSNWRDIISSRIYRTAVWFLSTTAAILFVPYWYGRLAAFLLPIPPAPEPVTAMYWCLGIIALMVTTMAVGLVSMLWVTIYNSVKGD